MFTDVISFWKTSVFKNTWRLKLQMQKAQVFLVVWMHRLFISSLEDLILSFGGPSRRKKKETTFSCKLCISTGGIFLWIDRKNQVIPEHLCFSFVYVCTYFRMECYIAFLFNHIKPARDWINQWCKAVLKNYTSLESCMQVQTIL